MKQDSEYPYSLDSPFEAREYFTQQKLRQMPDVKLSAEIIRLALRDDIDEWLETDEALATLYDTAVRYLDRSVVNKDELSSRFDEMLTPKI
jgi:hypothetical protein